MQEAELAKLCLLHLECEEALLAASADVLREVYAAAIEGNRQGMADAIQRQQGAETALAALRLERDSFRRQAGAHLGIPAQAITVNQLALHFGHRPAAMGLGPNADGRQPKAGQEISSRLLQKRQSLQEKVAEVKRLGGDITLLSHYVLDFLKRFFVELTGGVKCGRYGPEGLRHEPACGSLLQAKG
jgi:hypothetical protein